MVEQPARGHTLGGARDVDRNRHDDPLGKVDLEKIRMDDVPAYGVALQFLDENGTSGYRTETL